jgi:hypothetical protein
MPWLASSETCHQIDVGELDPAGVESHLVDLEDGAGGIEQADELHHRVEGDASQLLKPDASRIAGNDFRSADTDRPSGVVTGHAGSVILEAAASVVNWRARGRAVLRRPAIDSTISEAASLHR